MSLLPPFAQVVDAADALSIEEQEDLVAILRRRLAEEGRHRVTEEIVQGKAEYAQGGLESMSPEDIVRRARS